jgi:hypothetical protein
MIWIPFGGVINGSDVQSVLIVNIRIEVIQTVGGDQIFIGWQLCIGMQSVSFSVLSIDDGWSETKKEIRTKIYSQ